MQRLSLLCKGAGVVHLDAGSVAVQPAFARPIRFLKLLHLRLHCMILVEEDARPPFFLIEDDFECFIDIFLLSELDRWWCSTVLIRLFSTRYGHHVSGADVLAVDFGIVGPLADTKGDTLPVTLQGAGLSCQQVTVLDSLCIESGLTWPIFDLILGLNR